MKTIITWLAILALVLGKVAAAEPAADKMLEKGADKSDDSRQSDVLPDYVLQPGDVISVQVFQEEELSRSVRLSQESVVELPLIRSVDLKSKTIKQAQDLICQLYDADYLVNPQVNISVTEYSRRTVTVLGNVGSPGLVSFPSEKGLDLLTAISGAGGFTRIADKKHVTLKRTNSEGKTEKYEINVEKIISGDSKENWPLQKGDVIYVPERFL